MQRMAEIIILGKEKNRLSSFSLWFSA